MNHNWWSMIRWRQPQSYSSKFFFNEAKTSLEQKFDIKSICVRDKSVSYDVHVTLLYWKISISVEITSTLSVQGFSLVTWFSGVFSHHTRLLQPFFSPGHRVSNWTCNRSVRRHPFHHIGSFRCHFKFKYLPLGDHQFHHKHHFHVIWKLATKQPVTSHTVQRWFHQSSLSIFRHSRHDDTEPFVSFGKLRISWIQSDPWVELLLVK